MHGLRDFNFEKIGPFNEANKLILGTSRLGNDGRQNSDVSNPTSSKRGSKRKANDSTYGNNSYYGTNGNNSSSIEFI